MAMQKSNPALAEGLWSAIVALDIVEPGDNLTYALEVTNPWSGESARALSTARAASHSAAVMSRARFAAPPTRTLTRCCPCQARGRQAPLQ
jgi:hypothetical protein